MAALLRVQQTGRRLTLTLDDPRRQNALSAEMVAAIGHALDGAPSGLAALVIEGARRGLQRGRRPEVAVGGPGEASRRRARPIRCWRSTPPAAASSPASPRCRS